MEVIPGTDNLGRAPMRDGRDYPVFELERRGRTCTAISPLVAGRAATCTNAAYGIFADHGGRLLPRGQSYVSAPR